MTRQNTVIRGLFTATLAGGTLVGLQCGDLMGSSIKNGIYNFILGSDSTAGVMNQFGNFVTDFFTGGYTGNNDNSED